MVTVKLEICFDSGQFTGGTKKIPDQCVVVIYPPKKFVNMTNLAREFRKFWSNVVNCSEIYAIF